MVHEIDDEGEGLTQWEIDFISNMLDEIEEWEEAGEEPHFTGFQETKIREIYEERVL